MIILISAGVILVLLLLVVVVALCVPVSTKITDSAKIVVSELVFSEQARQGYVERMTDAQPAVNDRLLEGEGKNHMFDALAKVISNKDRSVHSVLDQVGDTFS